MLKHENCFYIRGESLSCNKQFYMYLSNLKRNRIHSCRTPIINVSFIGIIRFSWSVEIHGVDKIYNLFHIYTNLLSFFAKRMLIPIDDCLSWLLNRYP